MSGDTSCLTDGALLIKSLSVGCLLEQVAKLCGSHPRIQLWPLSHQAPTVTEGPGTHVQVFELPVLGGYSTLYTLLTYPQSPGPWDRPGLGLELQVIWTGWSHRLSSVYGVNLCGW